MKELLSSSTITNSGKRKNTLKLNMNCSLIKLFQIKNIFTIQSNIGLLHIFPLLSSHCFGHPINFSFFPCLSILLEITFSAIVENHFER